MKRTTKQILGYVGLGLVTAITAIAVALPVANANAFGSEINLKVVVHTQTPSTVIQSPTDGSEFTNSSIQISNIYSQASTIRYTLTHIDNNGTRTDYNLPDYIASTSGTADGTHNWTLNLNNYGGQYGQYILSSTVGAVTDYISFSYNTINSNPSGTTTDPTTKDPIITVNYNDDVCSLKIQAYNKLTGAALFNPEFVYTIPTPRPASNTSKVTLPFSQYNANAGDYSVVISAYGCGNNQNNQVGDNTQTDVNNYQPSTNPVTTNPSGDPTVAVKYNSPVEICIIRFQAYNKATNAALFHPEYEHVVDPPSMSGAINVNLPFAQYNADSGDYRIVATLYSCVNNQPSGTFNYDFNGYVKPTTPGVPDTGGGFFAGLNFSRKDYLITGLVVFALALIIAARVMAKSRKNNHRR